MANIEKLSITLTAQQAQDISAAVEAGEYASNSEVIREAVRDWQSKRATQRLRQLWEAGEGSGEARAHDLKALRAETRQRITAAKEGA